MREVALNQMLSPVKKGDEIFLYVGNTAFKGKYDKILSAAIGVKMSVKIKDEDGNPVLCDLVVATEDVKAVAIPREKVSHIQQAPDHEINVDLRKAGANG